MPRHIVSFSGGKDSTAMLLMMLERGMRVDEILAFDTGWEFPEMHKHWKQVEEYTGRGITVVRPKKSFEHWMLHREVQTRDGVPRRGKGWPGAVRKWCTGVKRDALHKGRRKDLWYIGYAADESSRERAPKGMTFYFPLLRWGVTEAEALAYCYDRGFTWGGLYNFFPRVSCFCCPLQSLGALRGIREHFPKLWAQMLEWDSQVSPESKGFRNYKDLHALEERFAREDLQVKLFKEESA